MDISQIYSLSVGGILVTVIAYRFAAFGSHVVRTHTATFWSKHVLYPFVCRRFRYIGPVTRLELVFQTCYWGGTAFCNIFRIHTVAQAGSRAGSLSIINLIPLFFADHLGFAADIIGISLRAYARLHGSFGLMAFIQALVHVLIAIQSLPFSMKDILQFYGLLVSLRSWQHRNHVY